MKNLSNCKFVDRSLKYLFEISNSTYLYSTEISLFLTMTRSECYLHIFQTAFYLVMIKIYLIIK